MIDWLPWLQTQFIPLPRNLSTVSTSDPLYKTTLLLERSKELIEHSFPINLKFIVAIMDLRQTISPPCGSLTRGIWTVVWLVIALFVKAGFPLLTENGGGCRKNSCHGKHSQSVTENMGNLKTWPKQKEIMRKYLYPGCGFPEMMDNCSFSRNNDISVILLPYVCM